ncbi:hypothetical protein KH5H1_77970 [Corallococcus caeni]|uniref:hypothetical protein n=1 Tax=Corallococcus caeni TaxID=3082388 RepID=UPI002957A4F3|nr:hypothetical protein KH5H1_77970 [Corallococcus sp. KH5-1]
MSTTLLSDAIAFHDDLLQQGDLARRTHELLERTAREKGITYGGRGLNHVLRPFFVTPEQHQEIRRGAHAVCQTLEELAARAARDPAFLASLAPQGWEEMLLPVDGLRPDQAVVGRLDGFLGPDGVIRFIEYNPDPGGPINSHHLGQAFDVAPVMEAFGRRYEVTRPATAPNLLRSLGALQAKGGRSGLPTLAVFGPASPDDADEEVAYQQYLEAHGVRQRIVTSEDDWTYAGGVLRVGDFPVDVVTYISSVGFGGFVVGCGPDHPVTRALTDGAARFLNGLFRAVILRTKALFAVMSRMADEGALDAERGALLKRHLPWTRLVREEHTSRDGASVDLVPWIAEHREHLVLKPVNEFGGSGVTLGWQTDADTWKATLQRALGEAWVVQERVPMQPQAFPVFDGSEVRQQSLNSDMNPFLWENGRQEGFFVRQSASSMLNLSQGGSLTTLAVVRAR